MSLFIRPLDRRHIAIVVAGLLSRGTREALGTDNTCFFAVRH